MALCRWWTQWCDWAGFSLDAEGKGCVRSPGSAGKPGPISQEALCQTDAQPTNDGPRLKHGLKEGVHSGVVQLGSLCSLTH